VLPNTDCPVPSLNSGWWPYSEGAKSPGLDIWRGVDRLGTCQTESYMEKLTFNMACLSDISVVMMIMCVPLIVLLCQAAMGWIPALKYLLPGTHRVYGHVLSYQAVNAATSRDLVHGKKSM
jgi:hypothetical protein